MYLMESNKKSTINNFSFSLDYRTNRNEEGKKHQKLA